MLVCKVIGLMFICFSVFDIVGMVIYYINVMMCVGSDFVIVVISMIEESDKNVVFLIFKEIGKNVIEISEE